MIIYLIRLKYRSLDFKPKMCGLLFFKTVYFIASAFFKLLLPRSELIFSSEIFIQSYQQSFINYNIFPQFSQIKRIFVYFKKLFYIFSEQGTTLKTLF